MKLHTTTIYRNQHHTFQQSNVPVRIDETTRRRIDTANLRQYDTPLNAYQNKLRRDPILNDRAENHNEDTR